MNLYDTKLIYCSKCEKAIGEVEYDCEITYLICGKCSKAVHSLNLSICV